MHEDAHAHLGFRHAWGGHQRFDLSDSSRLQHSLILGGSGTGKSTLLRSLILRDIHAGHGCALIDPHGDLANNLLPLLPPSKYQRVIHVDASDMSHPIGWNPLYRVPPANRALVASSFVESIMSVWRDGFGPRSQYILTACVSALLECENVSLLGLQRMLVDNTYLAWVLRQVRDPIVKHFFEAEFSRYSKSFKQEAIAPIQNKVGQLLMTPVIRNILGQSTSTLDLRYALDHGKILLVNLAKGAIGGDKANFLGSLLVAGLTQATLSRADTAEHIRRPFLLHVDEFHHFSTDSFVTSLAEARKYGLGLTLVTQHLAQLQPAVQDAVIGNVANTIAFRTGEKDGTLLARDYGSGYTAETFTSLPNRHVAVKMLGDEQRVEVFVGRVESPPFTRYGRAQKLVELSRRRYGVPREKVEARINRWLGHRGRAS